MFPEVYNEMLDFFFVGSYGECWQVVVFPRSNRGFVSVWMVENSLAESRTEETKRSQKEVERVYCGTGLGEAGQRGV